jgi:DNA invertase Pin-like site-specific DNA recombinase
MKSKQKANTIGYIRVSTVDQDPAKNRAAILEYANKHGLGKVEFVEEKVSGILTWKKRKLAEVVESMASGANLIVPELSRLGRSILDILEVLNVLKQKHVAVHGVKENKILNSDGVESKVMSTFLALFAEIERDLISMRTKEGLAAKRAAGVTLGRPKGKGPGKSRLDPDRVEILRLLGEGVPRAAVARKYGVRELTLYHWLKQRNLLPPKSSGEKTERRRS